MYGDHQSMLLGRLDAAVRITFKRSEEPGEDRADMIPHFQKLSLFLSISSSRECVQRNLYSQKLILNMPQCNTRSGSDYKRTNQIFVSDFQLARRLSVQG